MLSYISHVAQFSPYYTFHYTPLHTDMKILLSQSEIKLHQFADLANAFRISTLRCDVPM